MYTTHTCLKMITDKLQRKPDQPADGAIKKEPGISVYLTKYFNSGLGQCSFDQNTMPARITASESTQHFFGQGNVKK